MSSLTIGTLADFENHRIEGFVNQTGRLMCVPLFTQIDGNLWMGGAPVEYLPREFKAVFDLYGHAEYFVRGDQTRFVEQMQDSRSAPLNEGVLNVLAQLVELCTKRGPTLVHCQAGLNRSGLLTALVLINHRGMSPDAAIALLRERRDPQVLCNTKFEGWLRGEIPPGHNPLAWA